MVNMNATAPFAVYVHWPFCLSKCPYCDFNSHVRHGGYDEPRYVRAVLKELEAAAARVPGRAVSSIFFGGRTPMLPRRELQKMGFSVVLYANAALQATIQAVGSMLEHLRDTGSLAEIENSLAGFAERQRIVGKEHFDAIEKAYAAG